MPPSAPVAVAAKLDLAPPAPADAIKAYNLVEGWVRAWQVPALAQLQGLENMGAAAVTLRLEHAVVGRGVSFRTGLPGLMEAASLALDQAYARMPVAKDATAMQQARVQAAALSISVELAGPMIPIAPALFLDVDAALEPGLDGLCVTLGKKTAGVFPAAMLSMNVLPAAALASAISQASGDPTLAVPTDPKGQPGILTKTIGASFFRFRVVHIAQVGKAGAPTFLTRGGKLIDRSMLGVAGLRTFAHDLAANLLRRVEVTDGRTMLSGTPVPFQGRTEGTSTAALDAAMVSQALARYRAQAHDSAVGDIPERLLEGVADTAADSALSAAAWTIAAHTPGMALVAPDAAVNIAAVVATAFDADTGWLPDIPESARATIAQALALEAADTALSATDREVRHARALAAVQSLYKDTPPARLVSHLPWLGYAQLLLTEDSKEVAAAPALRDLREQVWKHQLTLDDAGPDAADLVGGIVFTSARNPLPTWLSVRPVLFLARMARDERLTSTGEALREIPNLLNAVRFLRQLALDEPSSYAATNPDLTMNGVRASLWDQHQPAEATAMTLETVCELLDTLTELSKRP